MDDMTKVVKHLEMIQGVVNRLGHNSFLIKGLSMTILAAGMFFTGRNEVQNEYVVFAFLVPVIGFWFLDGYFLRHERLFRDVYNDIRQKGKTDFAMDIEKHMKKPKRTRLASIFSETLTIFYGIECSFVFMIFLILKCNQVGI